MKITTRITAIAAAAGLVLGVHSSTALARGPQSAAASARAQAAGRHCVVHLAEHGRTSCHRTFRQAIADATGGQITDAPLDPAAAASDQTFNRRLDSTAGGKKHARTTLQDTIVVSIEYEHADYGGSSRVFTGTHPCTATTGDVDFVYSNLAAVGFDNTISSFMTFGNCFVSHFENPDFGGIRTVFEPSRTYIGDLMNDRTSSLQWS
ncbi:hypothetical protein [Actinomadura luteofluorescens]|uniref:hypothetical protein n=1 Tax=Actinomadura luteofluorescens TaxID=46163 RepID=UPI0030CD8242